MSAEAALGVPGPVEAPAAQRDGVRVGVFHGVRGSRRARSVASSDGAALPREVATAGGSGLSAADHLDEQVSRVVEAAGGVVVASAPVDVWLVADSARDDPPAAAGAPVIRVRYGHGSRAPLAGLVPGDGTVLELPLDAEPLLRFLSGLRLAPRARVIGLVGVRGGAGASTLAAALAREAVRGGTCTALVDLDAGSGGVDLLLGIEREPGPRWVDLRDERGGFSAEALSLALPRWRAVRVLSGDTRGGARPGDPGVPDALRALASEHDLLVLDLGRAGLWPRSDGTASSSALAAWDVLLAVATCDTRSAAAAAVLVREAGKGDVRLVVRGPGPGGLHPDELAEAIGLPLAASTRTERGSAAAAERGEGPGDHRRGAIARTAARLAADLLGAP